MLIQWCLKGMAQQVPQFGDAEALAVLTGEGLTSAWLRQLPAPPLASGSHAALSKAALDAHVNGFSSVMASTPYISLSAGCVELDPGMATTTVHSALVTALDFATDAGTRSGYVFRLWVLVSPQPGPELPGFGEEVRELNLYRQFAIFHDEGEIAGKLMVPARQIEWVEKYDSALTVLWRRTNPDFVPPERISNVLDVL